MPRTPESHILRFAIIIASAAALVHAPMPCHGAITVNPTGPAKAVSPYLFGTQISWGRQGEGVLLNRYGLLNMPVDYSPFVLSKAREAKIATLRFHGDNVYNFRDGIGPHSQRPGEPFSKYGLQFWANDYGTDEYITVCRKIGAEPVIVAPYLNTREHRRDSGTGEQLAANWVEYCNGTSPGLNYGKTMGWEPTTWKYDLNKIPLWETGKTYYPGTVVKRRNAVFKCATAHTSDFSSEPGNSMEWWKFWEHQDDEEITKAGKSWRSTEQAPPGYFAWLREYFGHPEPYGVKYWEIGNEVHAWDECDPPYPWAAPTVYRDNFLKFYDKMKAVDSTIHLGVVLPGPRDPTRIMYYSFHKAWMATVLGTPGNYSETYHKADFMVWHVYASPDEANTANPAAEYTELFDMLGDLEGYHGAFMRDYPKPVMITENNVRYGLYFDSNPAHKVHAHRLKSGLAYAKMLMQYARLGVFAVHQFYFSTAGAWFQTDELRMIFEDIDGTTKQVRRGVTPTFLALKLMSLYGRGEVLPVTITTDKSVDALAVRNDSDGRLRLFVLNESPNTNLKTTIDLGTYSTLGFVNVYELNSPGGMEAFNESNPDNVAITTRQDYVTSSKFQYTFPAHSLTVLDFTPDTDPSELGLQVTSNNQAPKPGDVVTYNTVCRNVGTVTIPLAEVAFDIPASGEYVEGSAVPSASYDPMTKKLVWSVTDLPASQSRQLKCNVRFR